MSCILMTANAIGKPTIIVHGTRVFLDWDKWANTCNITTALYGLLDNYSLEVMRMGSCAIVYRPIVYSFHMCTCTFCTYM